MKTSLVIATACFMLLVLPCFLFAQTTVMGGTGLFRVQGADVLVPGQLSLSGHYLGFYQAKENSSNLTKDVTINSGFTFGLSERLELTAGITIYQDDNAQLLPIPGDSRLGLKVNAVNGNIVSLGFYPFINFPTAENHNVMFETYNSDKVSIGLHGIVTFDLKDTLPIIPIKFYINGGYLDNNLGDQFFAAKIDQGLLGLGLKVPIRSSVIFTEFTSEIFVNNTDVRWYNNPQRLTQGFRFIGPFELVGTVGFDISLSKFDEEKKDEKFHKEYADWKIFAGVSHRFTVFPYLSRAARIERQNRIEEERRLEEIRKQREKAAKELEEMKKKLKPPPTGI